MAKFFQLQLSTKLIVCSIIRRKNKIKEHVSKAGNRLPKFSLGIPTFKSYEDRPLLTRPNIFTLLLPIEFLQEKTVIERRELPLLSYLLDSFTLLTCQFGILIIRKDLILLVYKYYTQQKLSIPPHQKHIHPGSCNILFLLISYLFNVLMWVVVLS